MKAFLAPALLFTFLYVAFIKKAAAQVFTYQLSLDEAILLARKNSFEYQLLESNYKNSYWDYQSFKITFLPKVSLSSKLPGYSQSYTQIILPDGTSTFVRQNQASSNLNINVSQLIGVTGGNISASSALNHLQLFGNNKSTSYNSSPLSVSYSQSSFFYNSYKWQKKIKAVTFEESKKEFFENLENLSLTSVQKYFDALQQQELLKNAAQDYKNADTLQSFSKLAWELGKIRESEYMQAQLNFLKSLTNYEEIKTAHRIAFYELAAYLMLDTAQVFTLLAPVATGFFDIPIQEALLQAKKNRKTQLSHTRRRLQAQSQLASAKNQDRLSLSVNTHIGYSKVGKDIAEAYRDLNNQQSLSVTLGVPILNWGSHKIAISQAKENVKTEEINIQKQMREFETEIFEQVSNWLAQKNKIGTAQKAMELAARNYDMVKEEYYIGKADFAGLSRAQEAKNTEAVNYLNILQAYWQSYYTIRKLTLYDFKNNRALNVGEAIGRVRW